MAGPVMKELMSNILPYLGIEPEYTQEELKLDEVKEIEVPDLTGRKIGEAKNELYKAELKADIKGEGESVTGQFPRAGEKVNTNAKIILYTE